MAEPEPAPGAEPGAVGESVPAAPVEARGVEPVGELVAALRAVSASSCAAAAAALAAAAYVSSTMPRSRVSLKVGVKASG